MADQSDAPILSDVCDTAAPSSPDNLVGFYDAVSVNRAYERSSWNVDRYVKRMVEIIESEDTDPRVVLGALEILRKHALESLQFSDRILLPGTPQLPSGTIEAEVLPPSDVALLKSMGERTQEMLDDSADPEPVSPVDDDPLGAGEEPTTDEENTNDNDSKDSNSKGSDKGGSEDGGAYDTDQVIGHRPPAAARPGLCSTERPGE